jgi:hypothetical protein
MDVARIMLSGMLSPFLELESLQTRLVKINSEGSKYYLLLASTILSVVSSTKVHLCPTAIHDPRSKMLAKHHETIGQINPTDLFATRTTRWTVQHCFAPRKATL